MVGLLALLEPRILGVGFGVLQEGISGHLGLRALVLLALLKIVATSCTIASGGSGGVFAPSLFIGGMLGGAVGLLGQRLFPEIVLEPAAYVVVGMASFFASVANAPLAALILITEMTGTYHLLPPLMVVCAFGLIFTRGFSIYESQVQNKFHSPAHLRDVTVDVLKNLRVGEVFARLEHSSGAVVGNDMSYFALLDASRKTGHLHFVVVDGAGELRGMIRSDDLDLPEEEYLRQLILIEDMLVEKVEPIEFGDDLHQAVEKVLSSSFDKLPVIRREGTASEVLGHMTYDDLLTVYYQETEKLEPRY